LAKVSGATLFLQAAQDLNVGGRQTRTQYQYTLQDSDINELNDWAPKVLVRIAEAPDAARRRIGSADEQRHAVPHHRPRPGIALRHSTGGDRSSALRRIRPAAGGPVLHPGEQLPRGVGDNTSLQTDPASLEKIY